MRHAFATICGTNLASLVLIFLSAQLIKGLLVIDESAFKLLRLAGCLYIDWMAWGMIRDALAMDTQSGSAMSAEAATGSKQGGFSQGFIFGVSNPKVGLQHAWADCSLGAQRDLARPRKAHFAGGLLPVDGDWRRRFWLWAIRPVGVTPRDRCPHTLRTGLRHAGLFFCPH